MIEVVPMLAHPHKTIAPTVHTALNQLNDGQWFFDLKWDGIRCVAHIEDGNVTLINRRMVDITYRYPEIVTALSVAYPDGYRVFDGEVVCFTNGQPDFPATHRRDAQQSASTAARLVATMPASFVAFDFVYYSGDDLRQLPFRARHRMLATEAEKVFADYSNTLKLSSGDTDGETLWQFVNDHRLEGLIAKRLTSKYTPGRSHSWIKLKPTKSVSALVTGYDYGENALAGKLGALHIALRDSDKLVSIGKVGTGFKLADREMVKDALDKGALLAVEVEYQDVSPNGQLRFPSYKGIRTDIDLADCTVDQLS